MTLNFYVIDYCCFFFFLNRIPFFDRWFFFFFLVPVFVGFGSGNIGADRQNDAHRTGRDRAEIRNARARFLFGTTGARPRVFGRETGTTAVGPVVRANSVRLPPVLSAPQFTIGKKLRFDSFGSFR